MALSTFCIAGEVRNDAGVFSVRIRDYNAKFIEATGMPNLHVGTLNVWVPECVAIWPEFMIEGKELDKPTEDYLFERCSIVIGSQRYKGFRVRPYHRPDGRGGNGDNCLEIIAETITDASPGTKVTLEFTRHSRP